MVVRYDQHPMVVKTLQQHEIEVEVGLIGNRVLQPLYMHRMDLPAHSDLSHPGEGKECAGKNRHNIDAPDHREFLGPKAVWAQALGDSPSSLRMYLFIR